MDQAQAMLSWALATVRESLPAALRNLGPHPDLALYRFTSTSGLTASGVRLRSLLGMTSRSEAPSGSVPGKVYVDLAETDQYRRELIMSESAVRRGRPALELRLNEFSPIPVNEAEFDYRVLGPVDGGYAVEVSVVRRARLDEAVAAVPTGARAWTIGGALDAHGQPGFRYASGSSETSAWSIGPLWRLVTVLAGCVIVCLLWTGRLERDAAMLDLRRGELTEFARGLRDADLAIADARTALGADQAVVSLDSVVAGLATLAQHEPVTQGIRRVDFDADAGLIVEAVALGDDGEESLVRFELGLGNGQ
jgi:hypothetical protein